MIPVIEIFPAVGMENVYSRKEIVIGGCRKMKIEEIDNCDDLDDIKVFAILVTDVPSKYVAQAKKIDGKYYKRGLFWNRDFISR